MIWRSLRPQTVPGNGACLWHCPSEGQCLRAGASGRLSPKVRICFGYSGVVSWAAYGRIYNLHVLPEVLHVVYQTVRGTVRDIVQSSVGGDPTNRFSGGTAGLNTVTKSTF